MYLVVIAWIYVALMMAIAEAMHSNGTLLGGLVTFLLYGVLPVALVAYLMGTPARRKALRARAAAEAKAAGVASSGPGAPDTGGHAPADTVAPVREKP
ncbi:MAG TPA: hypothetical protein VGE70_00585 [Burkholderiaceae bacterium]